MTIRQETEVEYGEIYRLVKEAFTTAAVAAGDEQDFVDRLRASDTYIPSLALVAQDGGRLVGHVMLTRATLETAGVPRPVLLLAPLCVALEERNKGVGQRLMSEVFDRARAMGFDAVFLLGDPAYYCRAGFRLASDFGVENAHEWPAQYFQGCELVSGALAGGGVFTCQVPE